MASRQVVMRSVEKISERRLALQLFFQVSEIVNFHLFHLLPFRLILVVQPSQVFYQLGKAFDLDVWLAGPLERAVGHFERTSDLTPTGASSHRHVSGERHDLQH